MNERYNTFLQNVQSLEADLCENGPAQIQKIYSTKTALCFNLRFKGHNKFLWIGRGAKAEGVLYPGENSSAEDRLQDRFLELCRNLLKGLRITKVEVLDDPTHFVLIAESKRVTVETVWSWSEGKLFFSSCEKEGDEGRVFMPWRNPRKEKIPLSEIKVDLKKIHLDALSSSPRSLITLESVKGDVKEKRKLVKRRHKFLERKIQKIREDLRKVGLGEEIVEKMKDVDELDLVDFEYKGVKIKLGRGLSFYEKRDYIFKKGKAFKKAEELLKKRYRQTADELIQHQQSKGRVLAPSKERPIMPAWANKTEVLSKKSNDKIDNSEVYTVELGWATFKIGQTALANDSIRSQWSKKSDIWFHKDGQTSAHAYLRLKNSDQALKPDLIKLIGSAINDFSADKPDEIDLVYTEVKNLKGVKGSPGTVTFKKEKRIRVSYNKSWKEIIADFAET